MSESGHPFIGLVGSAVGGVEDIRKRFVLPAMDRGWRVGVTLTPAAAQWLETNGELAKLESATGLPVRWLRVPAPHYEVGTGLSMIQARRLLTAVRGDRLQAVYVLAVSAGLRRGELLGLRWVDVDLDGAELHVRQAVQRVGGELRFTEPKTRHSRRTIPLPALSVDALREHRARQAAERLAAGPAWRDSGLIFTTATGTTIEPRNLNRHWYALRKRAGLPPVRFHDLRHTCVTLLLDAGVPPHIVQAIAGHSGIQVTMSIYAHAAQEEQRKALRWLGERLA